MKREAWLAKARVARRRERSEFTILESFVSEGYWDDGPFAVYAKQVHFSVATTDGPPPEISMAKARLRYLSNKRWPKSRHEESTKPPLVRSPREKEDQVETIFEILPPVPQEAHASESSPSPGVQASLVGEVQSRLEPESQESPQGGDA